MDEIFPDGNMADVIRRGNTVIKQRGPWWPATRQVLDHLEHVGYPWSPRVLGENADSVELSYILGSSIDAGLSGHEGDALLEVIGRHTRELHDSLQGFRLPVGLDTVTWPDQPQGGTLLCHNDLSPWNTIMLDGQFQGFIDWDLVSTGNREWELAWLCWRWAPIYPALYRTSFSAAEQANRCAILLRAYGTHDVDLGAMAGMIDTRMQSAVDVVEILGAEGVPGFDRLLATGMHLSGIDDRTWFNDHRSVFESTFLSLMPRG